jgi:hypothetical protein
MSLYRSIFLDDDILLSFKSIFEYEYLREFESKLKKGYSNCVSDLCRTDLYLEN